MPKSKPCQLCGGSTIPVPKQMPESTKRRMCWDTGSMSWCGAGKLSSGYRFHVAQPYLPFKQGEKKK